MDKNDPGQLTDISKERADFLAKELKRHNKLYFQDQAPEIEDSEFDQLQREYDDLIAARPEWRETKDAPDQTVGAPPKAEGLAQITRSELMLSLEKALNEADIRDFDARLTKRLGHKPLGYYVMPKFDGLAIELYYQDRKLSLAATRGDGRQGENVTANALTIKNIPLTLPPQAPKTALIARGEVYMEKTEFARLNEERELQGQALFANPRNAAAGSLKQLDAAIASQRNLKFFAYGLLNPQDLGLNSYHEIIGYLEKLKFPVEKSQYSGLFSNLDAVMEIFRSLAETRDDLSFEVDGLVITLDDLRQWANLGQTARAPRWAVAAKFPPRVAETKVLAINVQVGRLGALTPVATMEPVKIGGAVISQASLHNEDFLAQKDIRVGDYVLLKRAGDIIPDIVRVIAEKRDPSLVPYQFPDHCPVCSKPAPKIPGEVVRKCSNFFCPARSLARLVHFASKNALDIEGLGPEVADLLITEKLVQIPTDIFRLKKSQLATLPRLGLKSANNLIKAIDKAREAELWRFINALSIPMVGVTVSQTLANQYQSLQKLLEETQKVATALDSPPNPFNPAPELDLKIKTIGPKTVQNLVDFFTNPDCQALIQDLLDPLLVKPTPPLLTGPLMGLSFVLTGSISLPRAQAQNLLRRQGAKVLTSITKEANFVIAGEDAGQKLAKAQALGLGILNEEQFNILLKEETLKNLAEKEVAQKAKFLNEVFELNNSKSDLFS
jgi:DNA ligase (NAD+)